MMVASAVGSYCGGFFRNRISETTGTIVLKIGITFFALKMIVDVAATSIGIRY
jgi:Na+/phosphate symporter